MGNYSGAQFPRVELLRAELFAGVKAEIISTGINDYLQAERIKLTAAEVNFNMQAKYLQAEKQ